MALFVQHWQIVNFRCRYWHDISIVWWFKASLGRRPKNEQVDRFVNKTKFCVHEPMYTCQLVTWRLTESLQSFVCIFGKNINTVKNIIGVIRNWVYWSISVADVFIDSDNRTVCREWYQAMISANEWQMSPLFVYYWISFMFTCYWWSDVCRAVFMFEFWHDISLMMLVTCARDVYRF